MVSMLGRTIEGARRELRGHYAVLRRAVGGRIFRRFLPLSSHWLLHATWITNCLYVVVKLDIPDLLAQGPQTAAELAKRADVNADALYRVMRCLATMGMFDEDSDKRFSLTHVSDEFRADVPRSLKAWTIFRNEDELTPAMLLKVVRTGRHRRADEQGTDTSWQRLEVDEEAGAAFDKGMGAWTEIHLPEVLRTFDFGPVRTLVDVGGGRGVLMAGILKANPHLRGTVYDRPQVAARTRRYLEEQGVADRAEAIGGNFLESVPAGADVYFIKHALHDWSDDFSIKILSNIRAAMTPTSRLVVWDAIVKPESYRDRLTKLLDLQQMIDTDDGRERVKADFERLFAASGLKLTRVRDTFIEDMCLIEAVPA